MNHIDRATRLALTNYWLEFKMSCRDDEAAALAGAFLILGLPELTHVNVPIRVVPAHEPRRSFAKGLAGIHDSDGRRASIVEITDEGEKR